MVAFGGDDHESFPAGRHFRLRYCPMSYVVVAFGGDDHESFPAGRHFRLRYCPMSWSLSVGTTTSHFRAKLLRLAGMSLGQGRW